MVIQSWRCVQCGTVEFSTENEAKQHTVETGHSIQALVFSQTKPNTDPRWIPVDKKDDEK
jgi:hypothetical protein